MEHPFINNLSDKSLEQLQDAITGLNQKLNFAYRTQNSPLIHQLRMAIDSYQTEYQKKINDLIKKQNIGDQVRITKAK
jgi:hypothetical protein